MNLFVKLIKRLHFLPLFIAIHLPVVTFAEQSQVDTQARINELLAQAKATETQAKAAEKAGDKDKAIILRQQLLSMVEKLYGIESLQTTVAMYALADLFIDVGRYTEALPLRKRILTFIEKKLGPDHPTTAASLNNLAGLLKDMGDHAAAKPLLERALAIREKALGPEHPDTATSLNNLALLLYAMGDYAAAKPLFERALAINEKALGPEHPSTASSLNNLAGLLNAMGDYAAAKPLYERALAIAEKNLGPEHPNTAAYIDSLAKLLYIMGDYAAAKPLYERALAIAEKNFGPEHPSTAIVLNNLALLLGDFDYTAAKPLHERALAIREKALGPEHPDTAASLSNLASLLYAMGDYAAAKPLYERALAIWEKILGSEHLNTAASLGNLAKLLYAMGDYAAARPFYERVLTIYEKALGLEHPSTAVSLNNLADLLKTMGDYAAAKPLYERVLAIYEKALGPEHTHTAVSLGNLANLFRAIGNYAAAKPLYERALAIWEKVLGPENPETAIGLNNLADLLKTMGDYAAAKPLYERALAIQEKALSPEHPDTATSLNSLASLLQAQGDYAAAKPLYERALAIHEKALGPDHPDTATSLNSLASLLQALGDYTAAKPIYERAWRIALKAGNPHLTWNVQNNLMDFYSKQELPQKALAIFYGKQGINTLQSLRANIAQLGKDSLKSFDKTIEGSYRNLAKLLIEQNRITEAERVLELLKEQEVFEFVRRSLETLPLNGRIKFTPFEQAQANKIEEVVAPLQRLSARLDALKDKKNRTDEEEARLKALEKRRKEAMTHLGLVFDDIAKAFASLDPTKSDNVLADSGELQQSLKELDKVSGAPVAALYTVVNADAYDLILTTAETRQAFRTQVKASELNRKIALFRSQVTEPRSDPVPLARELFDILLPKEAREALAEAGVQTLMWHLDGSLRLLPMAALHDGEGYLLEKYRIASFNLRERINLHPKDKWFGLGLGMSQARSIGDKAFDALPSVEQELQKVISDKDQGGIIKGRRFLDDAFSWQRLRGQLNSPGRYPLVHIASHFHLEPGNASMSFLLTGKGDPISLSLLAEQPAIFKGVDLLTLSACETAVGGGQDTSGREIDGLSVIAQKQGAESVLATLWPVADESTARLMQNFYRLREEQKLTKAEALRQAQLALLGSKSKQGELDSPQRGLQRVSKGSEAEAFLSNPKAPFAHPFYWAPFVLMGNWL